MLINLQPYGKPMELEVRVGDGRRPAGIAQDCPAKLEDMGASLRTIAEMVTDGLFAFRDEARWQFETLLPSAADWIEFVDGPDCGGVEADKALLDDALSLPNGYIILIEKDLASVYERLAA